MSNRKGLRSQGKTEELSLADHIEKHKHQLGFNRFDPPGRSTGLFRSSTAQAERSQSESRLQQTHREDKQAFTARNSLSHSPPRRTNEATTSGQSVVHASPRQQPNIEEIEDSDNEEVFFPDSENETEPSDREEIGDEHPRIVQEEPRLDGNQATKMARLQGNLDSTTLEQVLVESPVEAAKPKFISPEIFSPAKSSVHDFLRHFERCASANGWNYAHRLKYFGTFLDGAANTWYLKFQDKAENRTKTWADVKQEFTERFGWVDYETSVEQKLKNLRQEDREGIKDYYYRVVELLDELEREYTDRELQMHVEFGLSKRYHNTYNLIASHGMSRTQMKEIIFRLDKQILQGPTRLNNNGDELYMTEGTGHSRSEYTRPTNNDGSLDRERRRGNQSARAPDERPVCFHCRKRGHFRQSCPAKRTLRCYNCDKAGHFASDCRSNYGPDSRRREPEWRRYDSEENLRWRDGPRDRQAGYRQANRSPARVSFRETNSGNGARRY